MIHDLPILERPREKLLHFGVSSLSNAELLAILLSSGSKDESAISLATKVLSLEKSSLINLSNYEPEEFMALKGIGEAKACILVAAMEFGRRIATSPKEYREDIRDHEAISKLFMETMRYLRKEVVKIAMLDNHSRLIGIADISMGTIGEASSHPREVFAPAIKKGAKSIIIAHNHPSGDCTPSEADRKATKTLISSGQILGIELVDHIVLGDNCYISMRESYKDLFY